MNSHLPLNSPFASVNYRNHCIPLGDGLMVIRYLFGPAFAGDALINKAISPDSPLLGGKYCASMSTSEKASVASRVAASIEQGIDHNLIDVDKDGKTTPLGHGLMVIRRLLGSALEASALTSKAISPESPCFPGLIQSVSQAALPGLRAWAEVGGIDSFQCSKAFLP